jgi:nucleotide-binding universal stress UspA family protein
MAYRSLLVLLDPDTLCAGRTQTAIHLAQVFGAQLTGLAPTGMVDMPGSMVAAAPIAEFSAAVWDLLREQAQQAASDFRSACLAAQFKDFEVIVEQGDEVSVLMEQAQGHDLVLLSQADPDRYAHAKARQIVEQSVLSGARPTLVLPYAGSFGVPYETVMIAWDNSREAARAVADALPLLRKAKQVHAVTWKETGLLEGVRPARLDTLGKWLLRHGVSAEMHSESSSVPIADALLSRAADLQADLIVMGAYGHARWAERMLGGATRGLLASMTVPVLMSH